MKIAYCLFGKPINVEQTFHNIRTQIVDWNKIDFYLQSLTPFAIPDDIAAKTILIQNLDNNVETWMQLYKQLPLMKDWPLPRGAIANMLSMDSVIKQIAAYINNIDHYDLIIFSHWRANIGSTINLQEWVPLIGPHFVADLVAYGPNPLFMAMDAKHVYNFVDMVYHLYNWLQHKDQLEFPWGLARGWPSKYNWGLVLADYLHDHSIVCHHRSWPISLVREPVTLLPKDQP